MVNVVDKRGMIWHDSPLATRIWHIRVWYINSFTRGPWLLKESRVNNTVNGQSTCFPGRVGDSCFLHTDCIDAIGNKSQCVASHCSCVPHHIPGQHGAVCRRRYVGDPCDVTSDCLYWVNRTECREEICECEKGMMGINEQRNCQIRRITDPCEYDFDCFYAVNKSKCSSGQCFCKTNYIHSSNRRVCWKSFKTEETVAITFAAILIILLSFLIFAIIGYLCYVFVPCAREAWNTILWWIILEICQIFEYFISKCFLRDL